MRSLRGRLTLGVSLVVALVGAVAILTVSHYVERTERDALDERLERTAELSRATARNAVDEGLPEDVQSLDNVLEATGTSLRLVVGGAPLIDTGAVTPGRPAPRAGLRTVVIRGQRYRTLAVTLRDEDLGGLALLEVTTPLRGLERRQAALDRRLVAFGLVALLVTAAGVLLAADLVLRPLRRLRRLAAAIARDEDLSRRMPPDDGPAELRSLAGSSNAMLARLERSAADRERALAATRRFAADAGHELRTPLTSVLTALSALRRHPDLDPARRAAMLDDALSEHERLVALLDGLQALARGDAAPLQQTEVDLAEVLADAADAVGAAHPQIALGLVLPENGVPVRVRGWEPGLRLLADNLLGNAAHHGTGGGTGRIRASLGREDGGDTVVLTVEDDGPGIPETERERVLEPFARVPGTERSGSGLGLALVVQQAEQHGGDVRIDASALGGARVRVRLRA